MAKLKKGLVKTKKKNDEALVLVKLVNTIRRSRKKSKSDEAFSKVVDLLDTKIKQISYRFSIPGYNFQDIYQEALFALRFKAVKDYDQCRSEIKEISPFDKFAALCIRRHLSTKLKASYQNKSRVLNSSISLDQDRNTSGFDDSLSLSDIVSDGSEDISIAVNNKEYNKILFTKLYSKLSFFEKEVFVLYCKKYSYEKMTYLINKNKKRKDKVNEKSVDNAISRIKIKAREIYKKFGKL